MWIEKKRRWRRRGRKKAKEKQEKKQRCGKIQERGNEIEGKLSDKNSMYRSNGGINEFTKGKQYKEKGERDGK